MAQARLLLLWLAILCLSAARGQSQTKHGMMIEDVGVVNAILSSGEAPAFTGPTILAALETIGTTKRTLLLTSGTWAIASNLTIPANVTLWLPADATMQVATGVTVTVKGPVLVDGCGAFSGLGTVLLPTVPELNVCWFGTVGDLSANDTPAVQRAFNAMQFSSPGGRLIFPAGTYRLDSTVTLKAGGVLMGAGTGMTTLMDCSSAGNMLVTNVTTGNLARWTVRDMTFGACAVKTGGAALLATTPSPSDTAQQHLMLHNIWCANHYTCFDLRNSVYAHITDNMLENVRGIGMIIATSSNPDAGDNLIAHNIVASSVGTIGIDIRTGGQRLISNKILGFGIGVSVDPASATVPLIDVLIANNSIENQSNYGVLAQTTQVGARVASVQVNSNQFAGLNSGGGGTATAYVALSGLLSYATIQGNIIGVNTANTKAIAISGNARSEAPTAYTITGNTVVGENNTGAQGIVVPPTGGFGGLVTGNFVSGIPTAYVGNSAAFIGGATTFSALAAFGGFGSMMYCAGCGVTSGSNNICAAGGPGAFAFYMETGGWHCFNAQN